MWDLAKTLLIPCIVFTFFYLLNLPLNRIPFVGEVKGYNPPRWVLPVFCLGSLLAVSALATSAFFLQIPVVADATAVLSRVAIKRQLRISDPLNDIIAELSRYDGFSNFEVSVNGYVVLDSEQHCALDYQCKKPGQGSRDPGKELAEFDKANSLGLHDVRRPASLHYVSYQNELPFRRSLLPFLVVGKNYIDVAATVAGQAACDLGIALLVRTTSGQQRYEFDIIPEDEPTPPLSDSLKSKETMGAGGSSDVVGQPLRIGPYDTIRRSHIFRLCHRIRAEVMVDKTALKHSEWEYCVRQRARREFCDDFRDVPSPECNNMERESRSHGGKGCFEGP